MTKKCPHCGEFIQAFHIETMPGSNSSGDRFPLAAFICPLMNCRKIVSVGLDPITLKNEIVGSLKQQVVNNARNF